MLKKSFFKLVAVFAVFAMLAPTMVSARGMDSDHRMSTTNEFGVTITTEDNDGKHKGHMRAHSRHTLEGRHDNGLHLGWFKEGFMNHHHDSDEEEDTDENEDSDDNSVEANARAQGAVTEVNGSTFTIQSDSDSTIQVNTDEDTKFFNEDGDETTVDEIAVDDNVKVFGFWDEILNVFNAIKVRLF